MENINNKSGKETKKESMVKEMVAGIKKESDAIINANKDNEYEVNT